MKRFLPVLALAALAACGVDGPPVPPEDPAPAKGPTVTVTGTAKAGVVGQF